MAEPEPAQKRRFFQRNIRAFVLRDDSGRERVIPVRVHHWARRARTNLTWKGFKPRPGERIVAVDLSCEHRMEYRRPAPPGSLRADAPCRECNAGTRTSWEEERSRRLVRTVVLEIAGQPKSMRREEVEQQAFRMGHLVEFVLAAIEARCLPAHSKKAEEVFGRLDRHGRLSGITEGEQGEQDDGCDSTVGNA